ncbi:MAG TPA: Gfo/Idh/MocA family oxidoreductase [Lacibacter sp.]|nr:Gfo/Idh/MocA family oxidoreductase [Lacibacter sp.]
MSTDRRKFLRSISIGGGLLATGLPVFAGSLASTDEEVERSKSLETSKQRFNMCGYSAPKLPVVRVGVIGLGMRGSGAVERLCRIEGVEMVALCDKFPDRVTRAQKTLEKTNRPKAKEYSSEEGWKALCDSNDIDLVYNTTPWELHAPISLRAMKNDKHAASEVNAGLSTDQLWDLVETSERTKKHLMMLENCCYDFFEMLTLNMARNGLFGELVQGEGAYIHDLSRDYLFNKRAYTDMWRLKENYKLHGNLYPTHGLGPVAQCMNINRGDKMDYLVSMSTNDFTLNNMAKELAEKDSFFNEFIDKPYRGNMNSTIIKTNKGRNIMLQHDVSTVRPYSRLHTLSGTKGIAQKYPGPEKIAFGHSWIKKEELDDLYKKYTPALVNHIGEIAKEVGGHGGMDFIMDWRLIDCLRNGLPLDQDVYDAASWSSIIPLSERSLNKRSGSVDIPDFTRGAWKTNKPHSLTVEGGGTTTVRKIEKK